MGKDKGGSFFAELRRRNVFKVAMVYLIASWLLIQIAEITFPALKLPEWTVTFVVVILAMLLPIAVIFAWAFELTPEGLRRTGEVPPEASIADHTGQRMNRLTIGALAIAVALTAGRASADTIVVQQIGNSFQPANVTICVGARLCRTFK